MKRITLLILLALCTLLPGAGYAQDAQLPGDDNEYWDGFDPNAPYEPDQQTIQDPGWFRPDGQCWQYSGGNYTGLAPICETSSQACIRAALAKEQSCVDACRRRCGNTNNTNGSCWESCGDSCRNQRETDLGNC